MTQNNPKICAVIQARMTSTRLPGKVLMPLVGSKTILECVIERVSHIKGLNNIVVALPEGEEHNAIETLVHELKNKFQCPVSSIRGSENDVLSRTIKAAESVKADIALRITSDCPFIDPDVSTDLLNAFLASDVDYARLNSEKGYPLGFDTEVVFLAALKKAADNNPDDFEREHATPYIWRRPDEFKSIIITGTPDHRDWRLVVDEPKDYEFAKKLSSLLEKRKINNESFLHYKDIQDVLYKNMDLLKINAKIEQKAAIGRTT